MSTSPPLDWAALRESLRTAVVDATELNDNSVFWIGQSGRVTKRPYATLFVSNVRRVGYDEHTQDYDEDRDLGQEIGLGRVGIREFNLSVRAYSTQVEDLNGESAISLLERLRSRLELESLRDALLEGGIVVFDVGDVVDVGELKDKAWNSDAALELRCRTSAEVTEYTGYIETVELVPDTN